jgi:peptide deformylase
MALPAIITVPHPALRQHLEPVRTFDGSLADLAKIMLKVMRQADGVGLAANQIGRLERMFVYAIDEDLEVDDRIIPAVPPQVVINPAITVMSRATTVEEEGCLSIPHLYGPVIRPARITLQGLTAEGRPFSREMADYEARVVQHETDHLNGILFLDHVVDPGKIRRA